MSQEKRYSDEFLNAFVDDQIAADENSRAYIEIGQNEALNRQVCELRKLRDLVQLAYRELPAPPERASTGPTGPTMRRARLRFGVAASVLLTLGILLGGLIRLPGPAITLQTNTAPNPTTDRVVVTASHKAMAVATAARNANVAAAPERAPAPSLAGAQSALAMSVAAAPAAPGPVVAQSNSPGNAQAKVLVHLARDDAAQLGQALDDIEGLLKHYRATHQTARVEVVVNGKGLELVRIDTSAFAARIQQLQRDYDNLTIAACQNTIDRLAREQGIIVRLLPGVITIDSGMAEIMRRQNQGWTYLQV